MFVTHSSLQMMLIFNAKKKMSYFMCLILLHIGDMAHVFSLLAGHLKQLILVVDLHKLRHVSYKIADFTHETMK